MRMDVRRAFFGLQFARDATEVVHDAFDRLDRAVDGVKKKLAKGDKDVTDVDRLRLEYFKQDLTSQSLQAPKGESYALAGLRFLTGVEEQFDVVDEPLKRPDRPLAAVAQYLEAARVLRPDVNMARAGIVARKALVDYNRARLYPDFGLGLGADYVSTPSATPQFDLYANDPFNHFYYYFGLGLRWSLDLLPQNARMHQAEAQLSETRSLERLALGNAEYEVEKAYADVVEAKAREESWEKAEHLAKQWISTVQDHIDLGTWNEGWLMEPLRNYGYSRTFHLQALMDYNVALSNLALVSGWDSAAPSGA
jgi:outer membrane protein TolC